MNKKSNKKFKSKIKISIPEPYICKICSKELKSIPGLASHLKNQHNELSYGEYILKYYNIDVDKINSEWEITRNERKEKQLEGLKKYTKTLKNKSIKERLNEEQYKQFRYNMKGVFSLSWFIKKHGEIEGIIKYNERSLSISKTTHFRNINNNKQKWSKISQELFWSVYNIIQNKFNKIYFGELNHEYSCGIYSHNFDFVIEDIKKVIEFNGDKFHANPTIYKENDIPLKFINKTSKEIWDKDKNKINKLLNNNYKVKIIWECDFLNDKEQTIKNCLDFLLE
jgi:hypothetical protein